ncbi:MAG: SUMF1/EgtB/PvdO family nonheme iron enzyme, partial [Planctomycetota bacterium]|nr:SUMF1/EgtB/PvdO family nonheme iron enzyme [Planctomycetota bacterium]
MIPKRRHLNTAALIIAILTTLPGCNPPPKNKAPADSDIKAKAEPPKWVAPRILLDRELWNKAKPKDQDLAIEEVQKRLESNYAFVETMTYQCGPSAETRQEHRIASFKHIKTGLLLQLIPGGAYQMGSNEKIQEQPIHKVTVKPMLVGKYEVTQAQWQKFMKVNRAKTKGPDNPA